MVLVEIDSGKIKGKICPNKNQNYFSFQNIPYAQPPIGNLRFRAPQPVKAWDGVRDATQEGPESVSRHFVTRESVGSEDCLHLNVYTPQLTGKPKPVMVWIHGGLLTTCSNKTEFFGPDFLVQEDVVVVVINYRLGILGFLSLDDPTLGVPGNAGFKDMVMALKWVQRNIAKFGGDANNVTIFGESVGGVASHLLMLSPMTKGLFHRVIAQSSCALNIWVEGRRCAKIIAKKLGFYNTDDLKLLEFLQNVPATDFPGIQLDMDADDFLDNEKRFIGVVLERKSGEEPFMDRRPVDIILSGDYNQVPLLLGYNFGEGMAIEEIVPARRRQYVFDNVELAIPLGLNLGRRSEKSLALTEKVKQFYYPGIQLRTRQKHYVQFFNLYTDVAFFKDVYFAAKNHLKSATQPIYFYKLTLDTQLNIFKKLTRSTAPGLYHGDDIGYLFKTKFTPNIVAGSVEDKGQKRVTKLWTNFARFGNPTPDDSLNVQWKRVEKEKFNYLEIGPELVAKSDPEPEKVALWEEIYAANPEYCKL